MTTRDLILMICLGATVAACATNPAPQPAPVISVPSAPVETAPDPVVPDAAPEPGWPEVTAYIGRPLGDLEARTGAPSFERAEGSNSFLRYDLGDCRVYAIVSAAGGGRPVIRSLSTGPARAGDPAPSLGACLNGR